MAVITQSYLKSNYVTLYLQDILHLCSTIQLLLSNNYAPDAPIEKIYVSMPTNIYIDLIVEGGKVKRVIEKVFPFDESAETYYNNNFSKNIYNDFQLNKIIRTLDHLVVSGKEYFYPDASGRPIVLSPPWTDGYKEKYWVLSVCDIISIYDRVVLLGDPGSGKSTSLRYLTTRLIRNFFEKNNNTVVNNLQSPDDETLSNFLFDNDYIPIYIEIREFAKWVSDNKCQRFGTAELKKYLLSSFRDQQLKNSFDQFWNEIKQANVLLLLDGLDEITVSDKRYDITKEKIEGLIAQLSSDISSLKVMFSSRIGEYVDYRVSGFKIVRLTSMYEYKSRELIRKTYAYCYPDRCITNQAIDNLLREMSEKNLREDISGNPLLLSLIVAIAMKSEGDKLALPKQKSQILYDGIKLLIDRWLIKEERPEFFKKYTDDDIFQKLKQFASTTNENGLINMESLIEFLQSDQTNAMAVLNYLVERAGLIIKRGAQYEFAHKSFRSYLSASYIVDSGMCTQYLTTNNDSHFKRKKEEAKLVVEILFDTVRTLEANDGSISRLWSLVQILVFNPKNEWDIWLAGVIVSKRNFQLLKVDFPLSRFIIEQLRESLLNVFVKKGRFSNQTLDTKYRLECGDILGCLGDSRLGINSENGIPCVSWCTVDSGNFIFGISDNTVQTVRSNFWSKDCIFSREQPPHQVQIDSFQISKYPVTVDQFRSFLSSSDGYKNREWYNWSKVSSDFFDSKVKNFDFEFPNKCDIGNYPATGVSFIEAIAFCKWLSYKTGDSIRLPSEAEWEYVAKHNGELFPWGNEFDSYKCNCISTGVGHICSVGSFYQSDESQPIDLCGNIWEWTQSFYTETHNSDDQNTIINVKNNKKIKDYYLISNRGGSYLNGPNCCRVSYRGRDPINQKADRNGFRIVKEVSKFNGSVLDSPISKQMYMTNNANTYQRMGYGPVINKGDKVKIWYRVIKNDVEIQQSTFEFTLGTNAIHPEIESQLASKRVATLINISANACDYFGERTIGDICPNDKLDFEVFVMDVIIEK